MEWYVKYRSIPAGKATTYFPKPIPEFRKLWISLLFVFPILICITPARTQPLGNGKDGNPEISGIINRYATLTHDAPKCSGKLIVSNTDHLKQGDLLLIIQMQGAIIDGSNDTTYGRIKDLKTAGNFEYAVVAKTNADTIFLSHALLYHYTSKGNTQVIKVPQYDSPGITGKLTCPPWNGNTGGVLALDVSGTLQMEDNINASGKGFRGGEHLKGEHVMAIRYDHRSEAPDPTWYAHKGEGIAGFGNSPYLAGRGAPANGGGGGNIHTTGGGGGANAGCGGNGGWGYPVDSSKNERKIYGLGGYSLKQKNDPEKVFAGGGGGAGHEHFGNGTSGAPGGGIIMITAQNIRSNNKTIRARGFNSASSGGYGDGAGGAGAGGTIVLAAKDITGKLTLDVHGGDGGNTIDEGFGPGGGGSGGILYLNFTELPDSVNVINSGGNGGKAGGKFYGATKGCNGKLFVNKFSLPFNRNFPPVKARFSLQPVFMQFHETSFTAPREISFHNQSTGGDNYRWKFGDGDSSRVKEPLHSFRDPGIFRVSLKASNQLCSDTFSQKISNRFHFPNLFTPNGDGKNDYFPGTQLYHAVSLKIFNRWGQTVYIDKQPPLRWDGTTFLGKTSPGTYYFVIRFRDGDQNYIQTGLVTVAR